MVVVVGQSFCWQATTAAATAAAMTLIDHPWPCCCCPPMAFGYFQMPVQRSMTICNYRYYYHCHCLQRLWFELSFGIFQRCIVDADVDVDGCDIDC